MNESLRELQKTLAGRVQLLSKQLDTVTSADEADTIVREMQEFNHRVILVGQLLFREETEELTAHVDAVIKAKARVDKAIRGIQTAVNALGTIASFLALVDEAIDLAKTLQAV